VMKNSNIRSMAGSLLMGLLCGFVLGWDGSWRPLAGQRFREYLINRQVSKKLTWHKLMM
jgi:hypothetical protein